MKLLENKSIIVTGASSGIGRAAAKIFASHGGKLVLSARNDERLAEVANEITSAGGEVVCHLGDITQEETHEACVAAALNSYGQLDGAFNNAGLMGDLAPLADLNRVNWEEVIATNLTAAFLAARAQLPAMLAVEGGSVVFTSSFVGNSVGMPGMAAYATAKAGLRGLVKSITADYAHRGIRANTLLPGGVDTPMAGSEADKEWAAGLHPVRRIAQAEEIANAALFLLSDMSSFVLGTDLWVDGGNAATKVQAPG